jgi:N6-L-threonylcarbamoyladenine synthase
MWILGIETSCDDTSVAVVEDGRRVLAMHTRGQTATHSRYGGVIPELAARAHLSAVHDALDALDEEMQQRFGCTVADVDAVAATLGPGLIGSLLVGATAAKTLAMLWEKPFLGVHHLQAHVAANFLSNNDVVLSPPFLCLLVSGGHTQLVHVPDVAQMAILGQTQDDAAGEAYDKVGRQLGLPYPAGPHLDTLAQTGDPSRFPLPRAKTENPFDFSFSGLKTATMRLLEAQPEAAPCDVAAAFQQAVVGALVDKTMACARYLGVSSICLAGGVAANQGLRLALQAACDKAGLRASMPNLAYCMDNAAMVAAAAYWCPLPATCQEVFSRQPTETVMHVARC